MNLAAKRFGPRIKKGGETIAALEGEKLLLLLQKENVLTSVTCFLFRAGPVSRPWPWIEAQTFSVP